MKDRFVMLVEDDSDHVALMLRSLRKYEMADDILVMLDGAEALDFLFGRGAFVGRDTNVLPSVVLLDLRLPKVSGLDVLEQIRRDPRTSHLPVVVLTSSESDEDVTESYRCGANSFVRKPNDFREFLDAVRYLLEYWTEWNQTPLARH